MVRGAPAKWVPAATRRGASWRGARKGAGEGRRGGGWFAHSAIANTLLRLSDWPSYRVPRAECDGARRASPGVCPRRRHALCACAARAGGRRAGGRCCEGAHALVCWPTEAGALVGGQGRGATGKARGAEQGRRWRK